MSFLFDPQAMAISAQTGLWRSSLRRSPPKMSTSHVGRYLFFSPASSTATTTTNSNKSKNKNKTKMRTSLSFKIIKTLHYLAQYIPFNSWGFPPEQIIKSSIFTNNSLSTLFYQLYLFKSTRSRHRKTEEQPPFFFPSATVTQSIDVHSQQSCMLLFFFFPFSFLESNADTLCAQCARALCFSVSAECRLDCPITLIVFLPPPFTDFWKLSLMPLIILQICIHFHVRELFSKKGTPEGVI